MRRIGYVSVAASLVIAGLFTAFAVSGGTPTTGTVTACATSPTQTVSANGVSVGTITPKSACSTATYTVPTVTATVTTTVAGTTTVPPPATTTAPAPGPAASNQAALFVKSSGSDTCTRSATPVAFASAAGHVCATLETAWDLAQPDDTIIVENGAYSVEMSGHSSHSAASYVGHPVVIRPEPGSECPMPYPNVPAPYTGAAGNPYTGATTCGVRFNLPDTLNWGIDLDGQNGDLSCGVTGHPLPSSLTATQRQNWLSNMTIVGIYVGDFAAYCDQNITLINDAAAHFYVGQGTYNMVIQGGDFGNRHDSQQPTIGDSTQCTGCAYAGSNWPPAQGVTVTNAVIHDFTADAAGQHGDGWFIQPSYDVSIVKNVLARDDCIPLYTNYATSAAQPAGIHNLILVGNVVHQDTQHLNGVTDKCGQAISLGTNPQMYGAVVAFNSVEGPIRREVPGVASDPIRIVGNVAYGISAANSGNSYGCTTGVLASYNVMVGTDANNCGDTTNTVGAGSQFVSVDTQPNSPTDGNVLFTAPLGDYHLAAGAAAIAKVPVSWCATNAQTQKACNFIATDFDGNPRPNPAHPNFYDAGASENR